MAADEIPPQIEGPEDSTSRDHALIDSPTALVDSAEMYPDHTYELGSVDGYDSEYGYNSNGSGCGCGCCDGNVSPTSSEYYYTNKPDPPPRKIKPLLTAFTLFPQLPIEIQDIIWLHTLEPRTAEIQYRQDRGFYSRTRTPIALRACPDSRKAVINSYPLCFGSVLHKPRTVFNFSIDTLYFDSEIQERVTQFIVSMTQTEIESIQSIAVDFLMDEYLQREREYVSEDNAWLHWKQQV